MLSSYLHIPIFRCIMTRYLINVSLKKKKKSNGEKKPPTSLIPSVLGKGRICIILKDTNTLSYKHRCMLSSCISSERFIILLIIIFINLWHLIWLILFNLSNNIWVATCHVWFINSRLSNTFCYYYSWEGLINVFTS